MMKTFITALLFAFMLSTAAAQIPQAPGLEWAKGYGANRRVGEGQNPSLMAVDGAGNVYITGSFSGTVDFDPGPGVAERTSAGAFDVYLLKLDASGNFQWAHQFGGTGPEQAGTLALDGSGNVYITGSFNATVDFDPGPGSNPRTAQGNVYQTKFGSSTYTQDTYICKLTSNGDLLWVVTIPGSSGNGLALDSFGNPYILGSYGASAQSPTDFDPGSGTHHLTYSDSLCCGSYMLKLDKEGSFRWALHLGVGRSYRHMVADAAGNIYYAGDFNSLVNRDFDPGPGDSIVATSDPFIVKLDSAGKFRWVRQVSEGGGQGANFFHMALDATHLYATGYFQGTADFNPGAGTANLTSAGGYDVFALALDTAGNYVKAVRFGGEGNDLGAAILLDDTGNMYLGGIFEDTVDVDPGPGVTNLISKGGDDGFVLKLGPSGNLLWSWRGGARNDRDTIEDHDYVYGLALGPQGHIYVDGMFNDTVDFDPCATATNLVATRMQESFVVKLNQEGCQVVGVPITPPESGLSLAPNPATRSVTLTSPRDLQGATVRLVNLTGEIVGEWKGVRGTGFAMELRGHPAGVYFVEVADANEVRRLRLVLR